VVSKPRSTDFLFCSFANPKSMDLHHFDGKNLSVWMFQLQQNFLYYNTPNDLHKYMMASYYMDGEALDWLVTMERGGVFTMDTDWEKFVRLIHIRFGEHHVGVPEPLEVVSGEAIPKAPKEHTDEEILKKFNDEDDGMRDDEATSTFIPKLDPAEATDHTKISAIVPVEEHHTLIQESEPESDPVDSSIPEPVQVGDRDQKLQIPTLNLVPMKVDEVCDRKIQENKNEGSLDKIEAGEEEQRSGEAKYTQIQATNLVANTYQPFDESPQPDNSESLVEKQLPNWVACDNNEQHLFDERSDKVELVVQKHKWRWKQVVQEGDAKVEEEVAKAHIYGFVGQLNEGHHLKKQPTEFRVNQVLWSFDDYKFNFTKVGQEVLFRVSHAYNEELIMRAFLLVATFLEGSGKLFEVMKFLLFMSINGDRLGRGLAQELYLDISTEGIALCLISVSEKTGMFDHVYNVIEEMLELNYERTTKSFNALLTACVNATKFDIVDELSRGLPQRVSIEVDLASYNIVINAVCELDEEGLNEYPVIAAREMGFEFYERTQTSISLYEFDPIHGKKLERSCKLLSILEFSSSRKRMFVIVRNEEGKLLLLCKGADSVMFERLAKNGREFEEQTKEHINEYVDAGLRALVLAYRALDEEEHNELNMEFTKAKKSLSTCNVDLNKEEDEVATREGILVGTGEVGVTTRDEHTVLYFELVCGSGRMKHLTAEASFDCSKQLSLVDFVVLKHRWRWKRVDEEEEMNASFLPENASRICRLVVRENATKISNTRKISRICRWKKKQMRWLKWTLRYAAVAGAERDWRQDVREAGLGADNLDLKRIRNKKDRWQHHMICFKQRKDSWSPLSWYVAWDN
jgi:hypothetical protein